MDDRNLETPMAHAAVEVVLLWNGAAHRADLYQGDFRVRAGNEGDVDYVLPTAPFTLVAPDGEELAIELPADATGSFTTSMGRAGDGVPAQELKIDTALWAVGADGLRRGRVPRSAQGLLHIGNVDMLVRGVATPEALPAAPLVPAIREARWGGVSLFAHIAAIAGIFLVPPTAMSLSLGDDALRARMIQASMQPSENTPSDPEPEWLQPAQGGMEGQPSQGDEGVAGDQHSTKRNKRMSVRGPRDNPEPRIPMSREEHAANAGILSILRGASAPEGHVYGAADAEGNALATLWGNVMGDEVGDAFGVGGLGMRGPGRGGCPIGQRCEALGTVGVGTDNLVGTIGGCSRERLAQLIRDVGRSRALDMCTGGQGGPGTGPIMRPGTHDGGPPQPMIRTVGESKGALSREQIRRTVRLHMNEVRYCYEQALQANPDLQGRVVVRFVVAGHGNVMTSVTQSSTIGANPGQCVSRAISRWQFPAAEDGGVTSATYPFTFTRVQ